MTSAVRRAGILLATVLAMELALRGAERLSPAVRRLLYVREFYPRVDYRTIDNVHDLVMSSPWSLGPFGRCVGYVLNSRGFRTPEYTEERPSGGRQRRVILLGDSFLVDGGAVKNEDHIATRLQTELERTTEVVNLGVTGVGPRFYLRLLELEGCRLHPDAVVVFLFLGNDLTAEPIPDWTFPWSTRFAATSYLWRLARNLHRLLTSVPEQGWERAPAFGQVTPARGGVYLGYPLPWPPPPMMTQAAFLRIEMERTIVLETPWRPIMEAQWHSVAETLGRIHATARNCGAQLLLVLIPDVIQVDGHLQRLVQDRLAPPRELDLDRPQATLKAFCRERRIVVMDLLPAFRRAARDGPLYMSNDTHWGPRGQRLAAALVAQRLREISLAAR